MLTPPGRGYAELAKEVIANWGDRKRGHVYLRGHEIRITPRVINDFYVLDTPTGTTELEDAKEDPDFYFTALRGLCIPEETDTWILGHNGQPKRFPTATLSASAQLLLRFVKSRIYPNSHTSDIYPAEAAMVYAMLHNWSINIGKEIFTFISGASQRAGKKGIPFPSLISSICLRRYPDIADGLEHVPNGRVIQTDDYDRFLGLEMRKRHELGPGGQGSEDVDDEHEAVPDPIPRSTQEPGPSDRESRMQAEMELLRQDNRRIHRELRWNTRLTIALHQGQPLDSVRERTPDTP